MNSWKMRDGIEFEQKIFAKQHAAELLHQELRRVKRGEETLPSATATDPYQPDRTQTGNHARYPAGVGAALRA